MSFSHCRGSQDDVPYTDTFDEAELGARGHADGAGAEAGDVAREHHLLLLLHALLRMVQARAAGKQGSGQEG